MTINTYKYRNNEESELIDTVDSLFEALTQLKKQKIDFLQIVEDDKFIELTLSDSDEIITNGYQL